MCTHLAARVPNGTLVMSARDVVLSGLALFYIATVIKVVCRASSRWEEDPRYKAVEVLAKLFFLSLCFVTVHREGGAHQHVLPAANVIMCQVLAPQYPDGPLLIYP